MRKKLEGNGMWESSRMMLPEHAQAIQLDNFFQDNDNGKRPELDEQEIEQIIAIVQWSHYHTEMVKLCLYDPYEQLIVEGIVEKIDPHDGWFQVNDDRFMLADIIEVI
jgi:putative heme degradation protein